MTTMSMVFARAAPHVNTAANRHLTPDTGPREPFEKVEADSFNDLGVKVIWTDNYDEVPGRIFEICNLDGNPGAAA